MIVKRNLLFRNKDILRWTFKTFKFIYRIFNEIKPDPIKYE